ncbi:MAG: hypothetical protein M3511_14675 [Deinococcota bacterium]|jgi:hypothetical protein|nr:hypothetical protein [Deinococcota bacterium]
MAKRPTYSLGKRQKDLKKKEKREQKDEKKRLKKEAAARDTQDDVVDEGNGDLPSEDATADEE